MHRQDDIIEIQGPPIDEIQKRSSCLKQGCLSVLLFISITLLFLVLLVIFFVKPNSENLNKLPEKFPDSIPMYDEKNIERITYISGEERKQAIKLLAFVPKAILSPLIIALENADMATGADTENLWESFIRILGTPLSDHRDIVTITWSELRANTQFLYSFYKINLIDKGFREESELKLNKDRLRFVDDNDTTVILEIHDDENQQNGTNYVILKVYFPNI